MARKDWYYIPIQLEQAKALDEMIEKEGKKYGIKDRTDLVRIVIGEFIYQYEMTGKSIMKAKKKVCSVKDNDDDTSDDCNDDNSSSNDEDQQQNIIKCVKKDCDTSV